MPEPTGSMPAEVGEPKPDPRPRPRYGEYAPTAPATPVTASAVPDVAKVQDEEPAPPAAGGETTAPAVSPPRTWDVVLTITLLAFGLIDVVSSFAIYADLPALLRTLYIEQGIGEYSNTQLALSVGGVANASRILILIVAVVLSFSRFRAGKRAWWVALSAGVLSVLVVLVCLIVAMLGDPAFAAYAAQQTRP